MTTEEKAKAYDEALEKARMYHDNAKAVEEYAAVARYENIFPELRESEDERIRKWLIDYFSLIKETLWIHRDFTCEQILGWLEKQKEHKELSPMDGNADLYFDEWNQQKQNPTKRQCFEEGMRYARRLQKEQKPAEWSKEDETIIEGACNALEVYGHTKLASRLKSIRPQSKQEWSEKDKKNLNYCLRALSGFASEDAYNAKKFLKSLRPSWKPSDEQMEALKNVIRITSSGKNNDLLRTLFIDLEKLI